MTAWLGLVATLIGCGVSIYAAVYAQKASADAKAANETLTDMLERQQAKLDGVGDGLSTKFLGEFPAGLQQVIESLPSATVSIRIAMAHPGVVLATTATQYLSYQAAISGAMDRKVPLTATFACDEFNKDTITEQLHLHLHSAQPDDVSPQLLAHYWGAETVGAEPEVPQRVEQATANVLVHIGSVVEDWRKRGTDVRAASCQIHLAVWIIDDLTAVFSFGDASLGPRYDFSTRDTSLIRALAAYANELQPKYEGNHPHPWRDQRLTDDPPTPPPPERPPPGG